MVKGFSYAVSVVALLFVALGGVSAQQYVLSLKDTSIEIGRPVSMTVTILNSSPSAISIPGHLQAYWRSGSIEHPVSLYTQVEGVVPAGGFQQVEYTLDVDAGLTEGTAMLYLGASDTKILVNVSSATGDDAAREQNRENKHADGEPTIISEIEDQLPDQDLQPRLLDGLKPYEPIYFLAGFGPLDAKFQISLRYQLFNEKGRWVQDNPWLRGFHLGYTQVSFWDLSSESKPFEDTNFKPEVFYGLEDLKLSFLPEGSQVDVQAGFLHESNGRDGDDSRSLNILYSRIGYRQDMGDQLFAELTGDFWRYVGSLKDNPDITDYRGHSSFRLTAGHKEGIQVSAYRRGRIGKGKSSYLFDLSFPLTKPGIAKQLNFNLHGQLFTGYGENLLTYDQKETRFRLGLGIYR